MTSFCLSDSFLLLVSCLNASFCTPIPTSIRSEGPFSGVQETNQYSLFQLLCYPNYDYNHLRPHQALNFLTPIEFHQAA